MAEEEGHGEILNGDLLRGGGRGRGRNGGRGRGRGYPNSIGFPIVDEDTNFTMKNIVTFCPSKFPWIKGWGSWKNFIWIWSVM